MRTGDFIARLRRFGELEWYRHGGGRGDTGEMVPPVVVWRFAEPRPVEFVDVLRGIVDDESREIDWVLDTTRRNWVLVPSRVMAEKEAHHFATEAQAVALLEQEDPEFCLHSVNDLERIVAALDRSADFPVSGCATS